MECVVVIIVLTGIYTVRPDVLNHRADTDWWYVRREKIDIIVVVLILKNKCVKNIECNIICF